MAEFPCRRQTCPRALACSPGSIAAAVLPHTCQRLCQDSWGAAAHARASRDGARSGSEPRAPELLAAGDGAGAQLNPEVPGSPSLPWQDGLGHCTTRDVERAAGRMGSCPCVLRSSGARGSPGLGVAWGQQGRVPGHSPGRGQQWHRRGPSRTSQPIPSDNDRSCTADPSPGDTGVFPAQPAGRQSPVPSAGPGRASHSVPCCHPSHEAQLGLAGVLDVLLAVCHQAQECFVRICAV